MTTRIALLACCALFSTLALSQGRPRILTPDKPEPAGPDYVTVTPSKENPQHFVARARDLLPILHRNPAADGPLKHDFRIEGVRIWPASAFTRESLRLVDEEGGRFDGKLRDRMLDCAATPAPANSRMLLINVNTTSLPALPVFLDPDAKELAYVELSIDQPGAPVLVMLTSYDGIALRVTVSPRTKLAGVRLSSYYPGVVLGVNPALVSQRTQRRSTARPCELAEFRSSPTRQDPPFDSTKTTKYTMDGSNYQFAIGEPQPVRRGRPTLGNFLDPDMPVPNQHGLVVLAAQGYILSIPQVIDKRQRSYGAESYQILKPFRIPEGLAGSHAVTFLLGAGVEAPSGNLAHSTIFRRVD